MIHVLLDTSIYRSKPRLDSPEFKALGYLANKNCVRIHIPYIVENEFVSYLLQDHERRIADAIKALTGLGQYQKAIELAPELKQCLDKLTGNKEELKTEVKDSFVGWLDSVEAVRYEFSHAEAEAAMDAYFCGKPPLKKVKDRKDIPDSFVFQAVAALHNEYGNNFHFVAHDGNLREACRDGGVNVHDSLDEFVGLEKAKACLKNALIEDNIEAVTERIIDYAVANEGDILSKIEALLLTGAYSLIELGTSEEPHEIYVSGVDTPNDLDVGDVEHYGEGLFVVYFGARVELTYEYAVDRSELYWLERDKYYFEALNEHYVNVETTDEFRFSGRLELEYGGDIGSIATKKELMQALQNPDITISELDDFEIIVPE